MVSFQLERFYARVEYSVTRAMGDSAFSHPYPRISSGLCANSAGDRIKQSSRLRENSNPYRTQPVDIATA